ncbi:hypothetical protein FQA39_LY12821 [Lamprigera yunnana]|nr:hypothetical protein FQA39_LY12821 [Lamprigera yunnana]
MGGEIAKEPQTGLNFVFAYEESYGYVIDPSTLDYLNDLFAKYGYYYTNTINLNFKPEEKKAKIEPLMKTLRTNGIKEIGGLKVIKTEDYINGGFPLGANSAKVKAFETKQAIKAGATEIDMVVNIGALKDKDYATVLADMKAVKKAAKKVIVKCIMENCLLTKEEIIKACQLAVEAKLDFVKTSTGFSTGGATFGDVKIMSKVVKGQAQVKAAGGVRTYEDAMQMIENGATRLGTSGGVAIMEGNVHKEGY